MYQGTGQGGRRKTQGCGGGSGHTHLATTDAHATVVELEFVQCEAGGALEQGLEASHAIRPEGVVTQVQLYQLGPGRDESLPESTSDFRLRSQGPCRLGTGESGLVLG